MSAPGSERRLIRRSANAGLLAAMLLGAVVGCDSGRLLAPSSQTITDLTAAQSLWTAQAISRYEFTLLRSCFCADVQPMHVTVHDGVVVSVTPEGSGIAIAEVQWSSYPSIERLFAITAEAIARPAASVNAQYDSVLGYPHTIYIDQVSGIADDEFGYTVTNVRVR